MIAVLTSLAAALAVQTATQTPAPPVRVMPYAEVVRCAGLTQAASELEGGESEAGRALFDAALYWSLAASQAAEVAGIAPVRADADQTRARILAVRQLGADSAEARTELQTCRRRTPDLG